ncbi:MAG: response regulator [Bacteroidales bacterium]
MKYFILTCYIVISITQSAASNVLTYNYSTKEGLSHKTVLDILRDSKGFLWIATSSGLNKFDGYSFTNYYPDTTKNSIKTLGINSLLEDSSGNIWLSSNSGIEYFNPLTETFHAVNIKDINKDNFFGSLTLSPQGDIWTCGINGLFKITKTDSEYILKEFPVFHNNSKIYPSSICWADGYLWATTPQKFFRIDISDTTTHAYTLHTEKTHVSHLKKGLPHELIIVTHNMGVSLFNTQTRKYTNIPNSLIPNPEQENVFIYNATRLHNKKILISTSIGFFTYADKTFEEFAVNYSENSNILKDYVSSIEVQKDGSLWIGTYNYGLFSIPHTPSSFKQCFSLKDVSNPKNPVNGLHIFTDSSLIWGNKHGVFYNASYSNIHISQSQKISSLYVSNMHPLSNDSTLIITKSGTIYLFSKQNHSIELVKNTHSVQNVYYDSLTHIVWCATWGKALFGFHIYSGTEYTIPLKQDTYYHTNIYSITGDSQSRLYLGMVNAGFIVVEKAHTKSPDIQFYNQKSNSLIHNNFILDMHNDTRGNIWIATCYKGIYRYSIDQKTITHEYQPDKNHTYVIEAIITDENNNVWFSSNHAISKYNTEKKQVLNYSENEGIPTGFYNGIAYSTDDGKLFFGGFEGLIRFNPQKISSNNNPIKPYILDFKIFGTSISPTQTYKGHTILDSSIMYTQSIELPYNLNSLSIDFASVAPSHSSGITYKYILEHSDKQWTRTQNQTRTATYASLQPGTYTFKVAASLNNNIWSNIRTLRITISPPWWKTWWFTTILILIILSGIYVYIYMRIKKVRIQNHLLEKKVAQRTEKLEESKLVIEMKNQELIESLNMKDRLIGVIGHDLRNPMSVLKNTLHIIKTYKSNISPTEFEEYLNNAEKASQTIIEQLNMMVDWARGNCDMISCKPVEINIGVLIADAVQLVQESALSKHIRIIVQSDYTTNAFVDPRMINVVFRNLLSNAIKFTPENGSIIISCTERENSLQISFIDTGKGIAQETLSRLFGELQACDISYGTNNETGSGLGLQVCKTFIEKNKGTISVQSSPDNGSVFTVAIPKGTKKANENSVSQSHKQLTDSETLKTEKKHTILLIDDNEELMTTLNALFSEQFAVIKAYDGNKALHVAKNMSPDIIICDIHLPGKSGFEICSVLKKAPNTSHIPILLVSGDQSKDTEIQSYAYGANDFIRKPFNPEILIYKINALVAFVEKQSNTTESFVLPESSDDTIIKKIIDIMNENIANPDYSVDLIAQELGLSRTQFWRKTKQAFNKSPGDLIKDIRLQKAKEMLETDSYRISEIAYTVGFNDPRYFSRCFSQKFGVSPSDYHKKHS